MQNMRLALHQSFDATVEKLQHRQLLEPENIELVRAEIEHEHL